MLFDLHGFGVLQFLGLTGFYPVQMETGRFVCVGLNLVPVEGYGTRRRVGR